MWDEYVSPNIDGAISEGVFSLSTLIWINNYKI